MDYWILDEKHNPVPATDVLEWRRFFEKPDRTVAHEYIGDVRISTVFLGIDHSFGRLLGDEDARPVLFETMIFGGDHDQYQDRCCTWDEAEVMHAKAIALVRGGMN